MPEMHRRNIRVCTQNIVIHRKPEQKPLVTPQSVVVPKRVPVLTTRPQKTLIEISNQVTISRSGNKTVQTIKKVVNREAPRITYSTKDIDDVSRLFISKMRGVGRKRVLIIVGNGPSILESPLERLRGVPNIDVLTVNKPDPRIWPTAYWAFCDMSQYRRNESEWNSYQGIIINSTAVSKRRSNAFQIKNLGGYGFSLDLLRGYHIGRSTVYASMQVGLWMGYERIYIFGCDMNPDGLNGLMHFYGVNPDVPPENRGKRFEAEAEYYQKAAEILPEDVRAKYYFCSAYNPWPFVDYYNRMDHIQAVDQILEYASGFTPQR